MRNLAVRGLAQQVAAKQLPSRDAPLVEPLHELMTTERSVWSNRQRETEPARLAVLRRAREDEHVGQLGEAIVQPLPVVPAALNEAWKLLEPRDADGGLHVGRLQVVADVRVDVLVVVSVRQVAELPVEPLAARVLLPRLAPAVTSPVSKRLEDRLHLRRVREHTPALPHRDVVRGIEAHGGEVPERADR